MKSRRCRLIGAISAALLLAACGGGGGGSAPPPSASLKEVISAAAKNPAYDTSTNTSSAFVVLQDAGLPVVTLNSPLKVNFTVFSNGRVVEGLKIGTNIRFAIARLEPGANGDPDRWVNYISRNVTAAAGVGPGGTQTPPAVATQANTDSSTDSAPSRLVYNVDGYYTYTFASDINISEADRGKTHRVAIQLSYPNPAYYVGSVEPELIRVNPYFDFSFDSAYRSVSVTDPAKTRKMVDVSSCNSCHEKLALHGGGRVDAQYCVMCHNPGTTDPESGNVLTLATMVHKLHSGRLLNASQGGEGYMIWGYGGSKHDYAEVGFPQDLRNCTKCHSGSNPATPQGDNWKTAVSKEACLTCHANNSGSAWETSHKVFAGQLVGSGAAAKALSNKQCNDCHAATDALGRPNALSSERVHWNQNEQHSARYKFNIEGVTVLQVPTTELEGQVQVRYSLTDPTDGNAAYKLEGDSRFDGLRLYVAYQNMVGQPDAVTEFTAYNNGGSNARVNANAGTNDGSNHYTAVIKLPANTATAVAKGTARVLTYGAVVERKLEVKSGTDPRPEVSPASTVNVVVQNTSTDFALTGTLNPRRKIVSNDKCNVCHGSLGSTSGSNTRANAFHDGSRNIVEACVMCHDPNRSSSTKMTSGLDLQEAYQFKRMIHGIHGNSKRSHPFTHGNPVVGAFDISGTLTATGTTTADLYLTEGVLKYAAGSQVPAGESLRDWLVLSRGNYERIENYAAEVHWPGNGINCNACHVDNSYKNDRGPLGAVVSARQSDPMQNLVISPKAASCTACHDSAADIAHVTSFGGASFANATQAQSLAAPKETCNDCHAPGGFKGVDLVHGQK